MFLFVFDFIQGGMKGTPCDTQYQLRTPRFEVYEIGPVCVEPNMQ